MTRRYARIATAVAVAAALVASDRVLQLESTANAGGNGTSKPLIGVDYPRSDTDFWNSYIKYVPQFAHQDSAST